MTKLLPSVAAVICTLLLTQRFSLAQTAKPAATPQTAKPRLTVDKKSLPEAGPRATVIKLAVIGDKLGALPEQVSNRLYEFNSDISFAQQARRDMTRAGIDLDGFNYIGEGIAGYTRTAMRVEHGRVQKMILWKPSLSGEAARQLIDKITADSQSKPTSTEGGAGFKVGDVQLYAKRVGTWTKEVPAKYRQDMNQSGTKRVLISRARTEEEPAAVEIGVNEFDWQVLNVTNDEAVLKAIQAGKMSSGMRAVEAYLAMRRYKLYRSTEGAAKENWTWTDGKPANENLAVFTGDFGAFMPFRSMAMEKVVAKAVVENGSVTVTKQSEK